MSLFQAHRKIVAAHGNFDEAHIIDKAPEQVAGPQGVAGAEMHCCEVRLRLRCAVFATLPELAAFQHGMRLP